MKNDMQDIPDQDLTDVNRRRLLQAVAGSLIFTASGSAFAQDKRALMITSMFTTAVSVRDLALSLKIGREYDVWDRGIDPEPGVYARQAVIDFLARDYSARQQTLATARDLELLPNTDLARNYLLSVEGYLPKQSSLRYDEATLRSQIELVEKLDGYALPLAPEPSAVVPMVITAVEPVPTSKEGDLYVLVDILLETLGITLGKQELMTALIESDEAIKNHTIKLMAAVTSKNWDDVIAIAEDLFKLFVGSKVVAGLLTRKVSFLLALKCVPIVGWVYCGVAFLVSVKKNYHRFSFA